MSQETKEALRRFEQKMREQGADGFADGPRPWEHWDESGHQANNRIWEGSARRIYPGGRRARSLGHRLLSVLALIALTTLLVGIGGVYLSHTQTRQLAETGVQPLPFTDQQPPVAMAPVSKMASAAATTRTPDLEALPAPAAGAAAEPEQSDAIVIEPVATDTAVAPATDAAALATATPAAADSTSDASPPATGSSIDSVAIETIVTEQSVTTTVYTRHPRQDEAEVVAAIETTPPPFAHSMDEARQESPDSVPATSANSDTGISSDAATETQEAELQLLPTEAPAALEAQPGTMPESASVTRQAEAIEEIAVAHMRSDTVVEEPVTEVETASSKEADTVLTDNPLNEQSAASTTTAQAAVNSEPVTELEAAVSEDADVVPRDSPITEAAEVAATTARIEMNSEAPVAEPQAAPAAVSDAQPVFPVAKTGDWVINLASYTRESTANRKLALFQQQGIDDVEVFAVTINDKPMYRIRVTGYESSRSAKADIPLMEQKLNLEGAWISKR